MRLLYETTGRASEVLSLDVEDVDLENGRAVVRSEGGDIEWLHFQTGCALLLPRLIAGRAWRPVFLTDRRPAPAGTPAVVDDARRGIKPCHRVEQLVGGR